MNDRIAALLERSRGAPEQRTEPWYLARQNSITASEAGSALGVNPYETVEQYIEKKALSIPTPPNKAMAWGTLLEPVAAEWYKTTFAEPVVFYNMPLLVHPRYDWIAASPDGLLVSEDHSTGLLVEIKCPLNRRPNGTVPRHYWMQMQFQMEVCDMDACEFIDMRITDVSRPEFANGCLYKDGTIALDRSSIDWTKPIEKAFFYNDKCTPIRVERSKTWFNDNLSRLREVWQTILERRSHQQSSE